MATGPSPGLSASVRFLISLSLSPGVLYLPDQLPSEPGVSPSQVLSATHISCIAQTWDMSDDLLYTYNTLVNLMSDVLSDKIWVIPNITFPANYVSA